MEQLRLRLQGLLAERFQVRLHRETKTLPVYYLIVAKHGPKLQPAEKAPEFKDDAERRAAMQKLALNNLNAICSSPWSSGHSDRFVWPAPRWESSRRGCRQIDHTVEDRTKVDGVYAFSLKWSPEGARPMGDVPCGPSIYAAVGTVGAEVAARE